jgi:hypothetical protein
LPSPKVNTHLPDLAESGAGLLAAPFPTGFGAGLAGLFLSTLRAEAGGAAFARAGVDDFDFAAIFLALARALAMTYKQSARGEEVARLTPLWRVPRKPRVPVLNAYI